MSFGQLLLDARLERERPVHGLVEFGLVGGVQLQPFAETAVERVGVLDWESMMKSSRRRRREPRTAAT